MSQKAVELKNQGNKAFAAGDWPAAIDFYTKAIELHDKEPNFFTNRAQVCEPYLVLRARTFLADQCLDANLCSLQAYIKTEAYGYAIADATSAIALNPKHLKVGNIAR